MDQNRVVFPGCTHANGRPSLSEVSMLSRREFVQQSVFGGVVSAIAGVGRSEEPPPGNRPQTSLGLVIYCRRIKRDQLKQTRPDSDLYRPSEFLAECIQLGAGGLQLSLRGLETQQADALRQRISDSHRYVEAIVSLPQSDRDLEQFEADLRTATACGASVARTTIIPGRRYERFRSYDEFREFEQRGEELVKRAVPVLERCRCKLAIENHKDQRNDERLRLFERISSEYVGACVDTGNSMALLEDPTETVRAFAPWAFSVHLKDQAVQRIPEGFLLADVPLGQGCLDLKTMVQDLKKQKPDVNFSLELITRDSLRIPCLSPSYRRVFKSLDASDLAHMIMLVESKGATVIEEVSLLAKPQQLERETSNVVESLKYARDVLGLIA